MSLFTCIWKSQSSKYFIINTNKNFIFIWFNDWQMYFWKYSNWRITYKSSKFLQGPYRNRYWFIIFRIPYPEPVYTGWSSVHWNATGWPSSYWDTTGRPSEYLQGTLEHHWEKLSWNSPTLECHWRNLVENAPHWDATGETLTFVAYTGKPLEGL